MIPWLAESWEYNDDLTELRITTRSGITWSDGEPFSAEDVAYTLNAVRDAGAKVRWGVDVEQFVEEATAESDTETLVKFKVPAPRFFYFMTYKYDIGLYIVPKHIFEGQDLAVLQRLRHRQRLAGDDRSLAARLLLAGAEGHRPRRQLVGGRSGAGRGHARRSSGSSTSPGPRRRRSPSS